jgi:uncharacterized protein (DUF1330 family)
MAAKSVRGGKVEVLEGDWSPERLVVLKFPSVEAARRFSDSPEYRPRPRGAPGCRRDAHGGGGRCLTCFF